MIRILTLAQLLLVLLSASQCVFADAADPASDLKGERLFSERFKRDSAAKNWRMEGPGQRVFSDAGMRMYSPGQAGHHVLWLPDPLPDSFVAQWTVRNQHPEAGLLIVFFAALGENRESALSPALAPRDGRFVQYTQGDLLSYHISYYANAAHNPDRKHVNLRKNNTFTLLQEGLPGIPTASTESHTLTLIKRDNTIQFYVDERRVIDFIDDSPPQLGAGFMGLRQMQWSDFIYENLEIWRVKGNR